MEHLVIEEILDRITRYFRPIKDAAYHDGIVGGIIVAQAVPRVIATPRQLRTRHKAMEESGIQLLEDPLQVIVLALGSHKALAPTHLANQMGFGGDALAAGKLAELRRLLSVDLLAVQLGDQDVKDGMENILRCALQQVGEPHQDMALPQPDGIVQICKREELDLEFRQRGPRTEFTIGYFEKAMKFRVQEFQTTTEQTCPEKPYFFFSPSSSLALRYSCAISELDFSASMASWRTNWNSAASCLV